MWLVSADARGGGTRDESLRVSAWDANRLYPSAKFYIDVAPSVFVIFFTILTRWTCSRLNIRELKARRTLEERAEQTASRGDLLSRFLTCAGKLW